ncbi:universal stress protein [Abyssibius alkaniclasticus]|uniref:universal stress protein n=1 Tax=Abyssibius alkaniclasticus TaxID=2881234 RepID=UPI004058117C
MMDTILCSVDINRPDEQHRLLEVANEMAMAHDAQLDVITVMPDFGSTVVGAYFKDHAVTSARDTAGVKLKSLVADVLGVERSASVRRIISVGNVYEEVLKTARINEADLIVIGAHRPDLKDFLLGPNAARVVRHANCSVYVVR